MAGRTIVGDQAADFTGEVTFLRPHFLTDPKQPGAVLDTLVIGEPEPHPISYEESGIEN